MKKNEKACRICGVTKPLTDYRRAPTRFGGDGHSHSCKVCLLSASRARRAARNAAAPIVATEWIEVHPAAPQISQAMALGFKAHWNGEDVVVQQHSGDTVATVWLSLGCIERLARLRARLIAMDEAGELPGALALQEIA